MKIKSIAHNQTEVTMKNGDVLFFSYETPVAAFISGRGIVKTSMKWSPTTSRHIHTFIQRNAPTATVSLEDQDFFNNLAGSI